MMRLARLLRLSETARIMCAAIAGLFTVFLAAGLGLTVFVYRFERPDAYAFGLFIGCVLSVVKVMLLEKALERSADMGAGSGGYAAIMFIARYLLTLCVLAGAVLFRDAVGLCGVIIGVLTLQLSAYIAGYVLKKRDAGT